MTPTPLPVGEQVRHRFPGLSDGWARFDGPAGTLPVDTCVLSIADYMTSPAPANLGGVFGASVASDAVVQRAREATAALVGAEADEIVFGPSTTNLMFAFTRAQSRHWVSGDRIVCTELDHDSNISPWLLAARDVGATVEMLRVDPVDGTLDVEPLRQLCSDGRTRWVAISGASNLTGHAPDLARAVAIAHEYGARILVDGLPLRHFPYPHTGLVNGDARSLCIAMASIVAKVTRDRLMTELAVKYPGYGFDRHKGYGTDDHRDAVLRIGRCPQHRELFLRKLLAGRVDPGQQDFLAE